jgi:hypothetical protein
VTVVDVEKFANVRGAMEAGDPTAVVVIVAIPYPLVAEKLKLPVPPMVVFLSCKVGSLVLVILQVSSAPARILVPGIVKAVLETVTVKLAGLPELAAFASVQVAGDESSHPDGPVSLTVVATLIEPSLFCVPVTAVPATAVATFAAKLPVGPFVTEKLNVAKPPIEVFLNASRGERVKVTSSIKMACWVGLARFVSAPI